MPEVHYEAFVLRLWGDEAVGPRASVTSIPEGQVRVFSDLDGLCRWLRERRGSGGRISRRYVEGGIR